MQQLMGVDFGTGGCKATIINAKGEILATAFSEYPSSHLHPGWSEQDPQLWIKAFDEVVASCLSNEMVSAQQIAGIGFSASTHNAVLTDRDGNVIRPCIMWNDQRSADIAKRLDREHGDSIFKISMQHPTATWTMPQLQWVRENEPENYARIHRIFFIKDYVRYMVTGDWCTDHVDAQGSLLYDAANWKWSEELCAIIGLDPAVLPPVKRSKEIIGCVNQATALRTGLREGTPVIAGCSDTAAEDYGSGAVEEGQLLVKLATAGNVNVIFNGSHPHPKTYTYPYAVEGMWYTVTGTCSSASSYRWLRDALYQVEKEQCDAQETDVYQKMDEDASQSPAGARGLIFHPYILGERCPYFSGNFRANFFGVSVVHEKKHFARAVLEGVAYSLYDCYQVVRELEGAAATEICLIGGGAKSPLWCQIISDVFGMPVNRPLIDDSSFGGALLAGVGVGLFPDEITAVRQCNRNKSRYEPNMKNHDFYVKLFGLYQKVVAAAAPIWDELAGIANQ